MKRKNWFSRALSLILTAALVLGLLPAAALAAKEDEIFDIIQYKGMSMVDLSGGNWVAHYVLQEPEAFAS